MFAYPKKAEFNRVVPKNKIYGYAKPGRRVQAQFVDEVDQIVWRYKLAPETINVPSRGYVHEIQIFDLTLKQEDVSEDVLRTIDKTITHPIFYQIHHAKRVRFAAAFKRPNEADTDKWVVSDYFITDWQPVSTTSPTLPVALDMNALYDQMLRAHITTPARQGETLRVQVERIGQIRQMEREAVQLEAQMHQKKQFNRKVELNAQLRKLKSEIHALYTI